MLERKVVYRVLGYFVEPSCEHDEEIGKFSRRKLILSREMSGTTVAMRTGRFELESIGEEARCGDIMTTRDGVTENDKGDRGQTIRGRLFVYG